MARQVEQGGTAEQGTLSFDVGILIRDTVKESH